MLEEYSYEVRFKLSKEESKKEHAVYKMIEQFEKELNKKLREERKHDAGNIAENLIGMELQKAKDLFGRSGWIVRCLKKDGKDKIVTLEARPSRINVETEKGIIVKVISVG